LAYNQAIDIRRKASHAAAGPSGATPVPARLLNNAGVLRLRAGVPTAALALFTEALGSAAAGSGDTDIGPYSQVTMGFNLARAREATGDLKAAEADYKGLLDQFPEYTDCHLRLACMARARGDDAGALQWARKTAEAGGHPSDALAVAVDVHLRAGRWPEAKETLAELASAAKQDAYARLAEANLQLYTAPVERGTHDAADSAARHLSHALELYRRVFERDGGNVFAVNGIGCALAEAGHLKEAHRAFLAAQEAATSDGRVELSDAAINLGCLYLLDKQYDRATQVFESALRRVSEGRAAHLLLLLARAHYDANRLDGAVKALKRAMHVDPGNKKLQFNLALTLQEHASRLLGKRRSESDPDAAPEARAVLRMFEQSYRLFDGLRVAATGESQRRKLEVHLDFIRESFQKAEKFKGE
jgi:RNA polymerase-associated protein CTR9